MTKNEKKEDLIQDEEAETGDIKFQDILKLLSFSVGPFGIILYLFFGLLVGGLQLYVTYFLSAWTILPFDQQ